MNSPTVQRQPEIARIALNPEEAAVALGVSRAFFDQEILHQIPHIRLGRKRLFPVESLQQWARDQSSRWLDAR